MGISVPNRFKPIFDFTIQVVFGTVGFLVVFGAAILISVFVKSLHDIAPAWVQTAAGYAEGALFAVDLFCFGLFILSETLRLIRGLWDEWRSA